MAAKIKNIVFDLGGVLMTLDPNLFIEALRKIDPENFHTIGPAMKKDLVFKEYETGKISSDEFVHRLSAHYPNKPSRDTVEAAWNAMLIDFSHKRYELLQSLQSNYRLFLLSNTNSIHITHCDRYVKDKFGIPSLASLFEKAWYSHMLQLRKPDPEIYNYLLADAGIRAEETLFIDDLSENTTAAEGAGIKTWTLPSPDELLRLPALLAELQ
ncbi:MAG: HAD family phosphatase [Bacteroidales bacterium]